MSPAPRNPPPFLASVVSRAHEHILPIDTHTHIILRVWILGREKEKRERRGRGIDKEVGDGGEEKEGK